MSLTVTVLDDGSSRPDLAERRETKYLFGGRHVGALRSVLLRSCRRLVYAGPVSTVWSLYFDDPELSACRANLDGVGIRHKTRLRWYDQPRPESRFYLETKWRRHRAIGKKRVEIEASAAPFSVSLAALHRALLRQVPAASRGYLATDVTPITLIRYRREHFALGETVRLTLDHDLRVFPQIGQLRLSTRFGVRLPDLALIECKSSPEDRDSLHRALAPLRARPCRFSKYVTACQRLGYASGS